MERDRGVAQDQPGGRRALTLTLILTLTLTLTLTRTLTQVLVPRPEQFGLHVACSFAATAFAAALFESYLRKQEAPRPTTT